MLGFRLTVRAPFEQTRFDAANDALFQTFGKRASPRDVRILGNDAFEFYMVASAPEFTAAVVARYFPGSEVQENGGEFSCRFSEDAYESRTALYDAGINPSLG